MARQLERWAPLGGIIFVVLMITGTMRGATVSDPDFVKVLPQMAWMILLLGLASQDFSSFSPLPS
jgi:hypothetical protein